MDTAFKNDDILYVDQKKSQTLLSNPEIISRHKIKAIDSNTIIHKSKYAVNSLDKENSQISLKDSEGRTLSKEQADFFKDSKVRDEDGNLLVVYHGTVFEKTSDGYFMIPVNDRKNYGVDNTIVFAKGSYQKPNISKVIKIALDNETDLSIARDNIYAREQNGISTEANELFKIYSSTDYGFWKYRGKIEARSQNSDGERDGRRGSGKTQFSLKDTKTEEKNPFYEYYYENRLYDNTGVSFVAKKESFLVWD